MAEGRRKTGGSPVDAHPPIHVMLPEDVAGRITAAPSPAAAVLWDHPVTLAAALRGMSALGGRVPLGASLTLNGGDANRMADAWRSGIRLLCWSPVQGALESAVRDDLLTASRLGLWNHIRFADAAGTDDNLAALAVGSPNIVHSWQTGGATNAFTIPPPGHLLLAGYGDVAPLEGLPLWRCLGTSGVLLQAICRHGKDRIIRRRVDPETGSQWEIGADMAWRFISPETLSGSDLDEICRMVAAGGSVNTHWVRHNLERAHLIAVVTERGRIVGNSSLKYPRAEYITAVKSRYGLDISNHLERGYTSVRPEYRGLGIGTRLLGGLTRRAAGRQIFSIIAEDNIATQKIAIRNRTRKIATVFSEAMGKQIGFWMPEV